MAIQFASVRIVSAGSGSAVGLSSYMERGAGVDQFTGGRYDYSRRGDLIDSGLVLPDSVPAHLQDRERLWNEAIAAEYVRDRKTGELRLSRHGDPQVAKSYVLALPKELDREQNHDLLQAYIAETFGKSDVAVQWAIHADHEGGSGNVHAHLLVSTRRVTENGFGKKARELNPEFAYDKTTGKGRVSEQDRVGERWAAFQNAFFRERGIDLVVDPTRLTPDINSGAARFVSEAEKEQHRAALAERNREQARDPVKVLAKLTERQATFTAREVETFLRKAGLDEREQWEQRGAVLEHGDVVRLEEHRQRKDGSTIVLERFTLGRIIRQENRITDTAAALRAERSHSVSGRATMAAERSRTMTDEQRTAFLYATSSEGLAVVQGRAGTGKSYTAGAIREAYEGDGYRVIGLAPTNIVAADMRADGFREGRTLASELIRQEHGHQPWNTRTVVVVDEMGMLSANDTDRLLSHARETGAKIIGFGDDRQLASVGRGGLFGQIAERANAAELVTVSRQREDWQKQASEAASRGDFAQMVAAYDERGAVRWTADLEDGHQAAMAAWLDEAAAGNVPFVYATTNDAVDRLNASIRDARITLGEIAQGDAQTFATEKGERRMETTVSAGDRIQFHATVKDRAAGLELRNGEFGTVSQIEGGTITAKLDSGRTVTFDAAEHRGWGLGYAGTTYKGQGKTNERTILLYDNAHAWNSRAAYVNVTRHKTQMQMIVPKSLAADRKTLIRQISRDDSRKSATSYRLASASDRRQDSRGAMNIAADRLERISDKVAQKNDRPLSAKERLAEIERSREQQRDRPERDRSSTWERSR